MMTTHKTNRSAAWKYALVLPILIGLVFIFSCKESQVTDITTAEPKAETKTTPKSSPETYTDSEMENVYKVTEEMPRFPGCEDINDMKERKTCADKKMLQYIYENLNYPTEAKEAGLEGQCVVQFIVAIDGSIENIKVVRDIGGGCGGATRNVVEKMNNLPLKWICGKQNGKPVKVMYTLPVKFKLEDDGIGMIDDKENNLSMTPLVVGIYEDHNIYTLNDRPISLKELEHKLKTEGSTTNILVNPSDKARAESLVSVLDIANRNKIKVILKEPTFTSKN